MVVMVLQTVKLAPVMRTKRVIMKSFINEQSEEEVLPPTRQDVFQEKCNAVTLFHQMAELQRGRALLSVDSLPRAHLCGPI